MGTDKKDRFSARKRYPTDIGAAFVRETIS